MRIFAPELIQIVMGTAYSTLPSSAEISPVDALWTLIQAQTASVRKALVDRLLAEQKSIEKQEAMVRDSLVTAFDELDKGMAKPDARSLFVK